MIFWTFLDNVVVVSVWATAVIVISCLLPVRVFSWSELVCSDVTAPVDGWAVAGGAAFCCSNYSIILSIYLFSSSTFSNSILPSISAALTYTPITNSCSQIYSNVIFSTFDKKSSHASLIFKFCFYWSDLTPNSRSYVRVWNN